jgi:hypothetical protein
VSRLHAAAPWLSASGVIGHRGANRGLAPDRALVHGDPAVCREALLAARWRVAAWLAILELTLGQGLVTAFVAGPRRLIPPETVMGVDSYLELFTTLYGWALYNNIWSVLTGTGLAFIPFIVILIRNFVAVNTSMEFNAGSRPSVRRMEIDIALALTVVVLAAQPALNLEASELRYVPAATLADPTPGA